MKIFGKTDKGPYRESNQDAFLTGTFETGDCWAVVCDGMGGVSGGQIAGKICAEKTAEVIKRGYRENITVNGARNLLNSAVCAANYAVFEESQKKTELKGMGTTIVAVMVIKGVAVVAHVGDSRAYLVGDSLLPITKDHSMVQVMIDTGKITEDEAKVHPDRNIITRAVGVLSFVDVDFDFVDIDDKSILLCTDGLSGCTEDNEIYDIIKKYGDSSTEKLVEKAIDNGGRDNITAVLIVAENQGE